MHAVTPPRSPLSRPGRPDRAGAGHMPMTSCRTHALRDQVQGLRRREMLGRYACGGLRRRDFLGASALAATANLMASAELVSAQEPRAGNKVGTPRPEGKLGIPGPYPGRVIEVQHPGLVQGVGRDREAIKKTLDLGMCSLTGAPHPVDAWRRFVSPGESVGIKVVPNGFPGAHTSPELVLEVIDNLKAAGIQLKDMVVFDRYRREFLQAGYQKVLP